MNHVVYALDSHAVRAAGQLNFLYTDPAHRGQGVARALLLHMDQEVRTMARYRAGVCDLRAERSGPDDLRTDRRRRAIVQPVARRTACVVASPGFRRLDFDYVQPPLVAEGDAGEYLDLHLRWCTNGTTRPSGPLPTVWLIEMLRRFFTVSVGKNDENAHQDMGMLRARLTGPMVSIVDDRA